MNCKKHPERVAVATCEHCGAGVCSQCASATSYAREEYGTLCPECLADLNYDIALKKLNQNSRNRGRLVLMAILYVVGLVLAITGLINLTSGGSAIYIALVIVGIIFCGVYTGISLSLQDTVKGRDMDRSAGGILFKFIMFVAYCVFGIILTPVRFVKTIKQIKENKKDVAWHKEEISKLRNM